MWEIVETLLIQFINMLPFLIPFIMIFNLASDLLFGRN